NRSPGLRAQVQPLAHDLVQLAAHEHSDAANLLEAVGEPCVARRERFPAAPTAVILPVDLTGALVEHLMARPRPRKFVFDVRYRLRLEHVHEPLSSTSNSMRPESNSSKSRASSALATGTHTSA